ncbi:Protein kinase, putative [Hondaea fermentalgiana]|uniref:Protein kinase, putative n=1 Tax=Hondaea fermentalgiana TaxID=2315210 RepID=A0A2R5G5N4_9STRA|nr:Protein kinase, putative [Hondaea fermentalgiana]|eukprot:GBG25659.1 Protein kinase, putative [Hondaea fermentalgiana]
MGHAHSHGHHGHHGRLGHHGSHGGTDGHHGKHEQLPVSLSKKFSHAELDMLRMCYKDLAQRSPGRTIDKDTFLKFFPLPGLHGERLFYVFDHKHTGAVDFEEFVSGLALCLRGTFEEKVRVIFRIYDIDNNDTVSKAELRTMLHQVPRDSLYQLSAKVGNENLRKRLVVHRTSPSGDNIANIASCAATADSEVAAKIVNKLVESAFSTFDLNKDDCLSSEQFSEWVRSTPEVLDFLSSVFPLEEVTHMHVSMHKHANADTDDGALELVEEAPYPRRTSSPFGGRRTPSPGPGLLQGAGASRGESRGPRSRRSIFGLARQTHSSSPAVPRSSSALSDGGQESDAEWEQSMRKAKSQMAGHPHEYSGVLYKAGRRMRGLRGRMFILRGSVLYYYYMNRFDQPAGLIFLQGCYVAARDTHTHSAPTSPRGSRKHDAGFASADSAFSNQQRSQHQHDCDSTHSHHVAGDLQRVLRSKFSEVSIKTRRTLPADMEIHSPPVVGAGAHMFPFEIITSQGGERDSRVFYAKTAAERDAWVEAIQKASNVVPFSARYTQLEKIGRGKFAIVYKCERIGVNDNKPENEKEYRAVKVIDKAALNEKERELLRTEIAVLKLVNHPNIIQLYDTFESLNHIYLVLEFVRGGELFDRIVGRARLKEHEVYPILYQLAEAVRYLHMLGVAHRDIKPENILCSGSKDDPITSATLKICDFGLSKLISPLGVMKLACGTLSYVAPEVLTAQGYGKAADIWNIGVIIYLVRRGRLPFDGESKDDIIYNTIHTELDFAHDPVFSKCSADHVDLIKGLLRKNPDHRLTAEQVLQHPWMKRMAHVWEEEKKKLEPIVGPDGFPPVPIESSALASGDSSVQLETSEQPSRLSAPIPTKPDSISSDDTCSTPLRAEARPFVPPAVLEEPSIDSKATSPSEDGETSDERKCSSALSVP